MSKAAAELKQAIWNIFPGDLVRLRKSICVAEGVSMSETRVVKSIDGNGRAILQQGLNGFRWWHVKDLVVVKQRPAS